MHNPVNGHYSVIEMYSASNTLIKNFRITDGKGTWIGGNHGPNGDNYVGGGIYLTLWEWHDPNSNPFTPRLENLIIEGNSAGYGGGIFSRRTNPRINNCIIRNNTTGEYNGEYGWQGIQGGGLYFMHSGNEHWTEIKNTKILSNFAGSSGAIHFFQNGEKVLLENVLVANNNSESGAGGIHSFSSEITIINSTIVNNHTQQNELPGGVYASNYGNAKVVNTVFSDNTPHDLVVYTGGQNDTLWVSNSIVQDGPDAIVTNGEGTLVWGDGNISVVPSLDTNYALLSYSVGIGEGSQSGTIGGWAYTAPVIDINGDMRPNPEGSNPDMGAFESPLGIPEYRIALDSLYVIHGDTALFPIRNISSLPLSAIELKITGFQGNLELIEIVTDSTTLFGTQGWVTYYNDTDTSLIMASAGTVPLSSTGVLCKLRLAVPDTLSSQFLPITITDFTGNEDYTDFSSTAGGIQVLWGPTAEFITSTISGNYPLTVSFTDLSLDGTYPIESWTWDFGDDSTSNDQNPEYTYIYPGMYDIELRVEDEFGLADSITYQDLINVNIIHGDINFNGSTQSFDAALILKHLVGVLTLSELQLEVGDVSEDSTVSALDASYILQFVVGLIDRLPYVAPDGMIATGDLTMEDMGAVPGMAIDIPIHIFNDQNIQGLMGTLNYDPAMLSLDTLIFSDYLDDYLIEYNEINPGEVIVAASGNNPNTESGLLANVTFEVLEGFTDETTVSIMDLRLNENEPVEIATEMTISYVLGIDGAGVPGVFALHQNYPNPFNPITRINYDLPEDALVNITIYDMMGRQVKTLINSEQTAGYRAIRWNGTNHLGQPVAAGMYLYKIRANMFNQTKKLILLK